MRNASGDRRRQRPAVIRRPSGSRRHALAGAAGGFRYNAISIRGGRFHFAHNLLDTSEFASACFAPGDRIGAVNSQGLGVTYTIWREDGRAIALNHRGRGRRF